MGFKYILDSIKQKFDAEEEYENKGFPDLNYEVGNTSGMDIAPGVPSAMDERIGSLAQRGGSVMEVIINNPSTFQIDRERMLNVINGLEVDISIHSDPSIGYTSTYRGGQKGYDPTHSYFTKYLEQFASFKKEVEIKSQKENKFKGFKISRINPHVSTDPLPALEEERAGGTGLDPFGYSLTDLKQDIMDEKSRREKNIYDNPKFLRRLYRVFISEEFGDNEYQYYQNLTSFSPQFDKKWRKAQKDVAGRYYRTMTGGNGKNSLEDKADIISAVSAADPAIQKEWLTLLPKDEFKFEREVEIPSNTTLADITESEANLTSINNLKDLDDFIRAALSQRYRLSELRTLPNLLYFLESGELDRIRSRRYSGQVDLKIPKDGFQKKLWSQAKESIEEALDELWRKEDTEDERKVSLIPVQAKVQGLTQQLEIPQGKIAEEAFQNNTEELSQEVENMFAGEKESFEHSDEEINWKEQHKRFLRIFIRNFERQMWMESNSLYQIIPAWLSVADYSSEEDPEEEYRKKGHKGWEAPKFLWESLVINKWEERGYEIDLLNPRGKNNDEKGFLDLLEDSEEFQMDVAAASAGTYVWSHFTQKKSIFKLNDRILKNAFSEEDVKHDNVELTWIEWMNKFGIGVNLEAMPGSPQQMYKIWRPKDIAATCRAINITARKTLDRIHHDLDEMPAKFTIDLEHTATFGDDPWDKMDELIEQEKELAESSIAEKYSIKIDKNKPLAKILRMWHLMRAGVETSQSETLHGPWDPGDKQLYTHLYKMVDAGFARNPEEKAYIMYEVGGDDRGTVYIARVAMNLIELGVSYEDLDPAKVNPGEEYRDEKEALMARFFGMDRPNYDREWAKIEENAFAPLDGLLEAEKFEHTHSSRQAIENQKIQEWSEEEYK